MRSLRLNIAKALLLLSGVFLFAGYSAQAQQFTVGNYQQVSQRRVSLYVYEYVYQAYVSNSGGPATNVLATVASTSSHTTIIDDSLSFGDVAADSSTLSLNTFRFQQDRRFAFSFSNLVWTISSASAQPPIANAGPAQTVPVGTTVTLNGSGSSDPNGSGIKKILWTFDSIPTGSAATLANATTFSPSFVVDEPGQYIARLTITDGLGLTGTSAVTVSTVSSPPVADAGISETFPVGTTVTLDGSGSTDVDGAPLTFSWSFVSVPVGSAATLSNPAAVKPTFVLDKLGNYVVQLIVTAEGLTSAPSQVTISTTDVPPVANAGPDQTVQVGAVVTLNGSGSSDLAGNPITFSWSFVSIPSGSVAVLTNPTAIHPTFVADRVGAYSVQLVVSDGTLSSTPSTVTINSNDVAPVANAGPAQTVFIATAVTLDGSASTDSDNTPLTYSWALTVVPTGSAAKLVNPTSVHPSFTVDVDGTYVAQLIVNDGILSSSPSTVTISTQPSTPTANAGASQAVTVGATVQLNGSGSSDPDNSSLTYSWSLLSKPAGSKAVLSSASIVNPTFVADVAGAYLVQLTVTSNGLTSAPSNVTITAATGAAAILVFTTQPAAGTAGAPLAPVVVEVQDGSGNVVTSSNAAITISSTAAGVSGTTTVSAVNGIATFSALQFAAAGTYTLTAASPGLTSATSNSFTVSAGTATKLVFTTQPTNIGAGAAIAPAVQVAIEDGSGNVVTSAANSVSILIGNNPASGTLAGTLTVSAVNGVATFSSLSINRAGSGYTLAATATGLAMATSSAFNVTAGTATKLAFTVQPANVGAGSAITPAVQVTIEDGSGNTVTSATNSVSILIGNNPASGTLAGTLTVSAVNGVATFTNLSINNAGTGYTLTASATGLSAATSSAFNVTSVNTLLVTTSGGALGVGRNFGATVTLSSPAPLGGVTVTLASANPGVVTVAPASVLVPAGGTTASFTLTGVAAGGPITLTATATGYTSGTAQITVTSSLISLATGLVVAPAQSSSLAFSLSSPAPAGGVTVNFVSSSTAVATITSSVIVPAGATVASSNPQVTGVMIGTVQITATAAGFAQDTESVQITVTASTSPTSLTLNATRTTNIQLNISAPAPAGGITFNLLSNNTAAATVPASVTVPAGGLSAQIPVTGVAVGSAMLTVTSAGINTVTVSITVSAAPALTPNFAATLGMNLQTDSGSVSLGATPPSSETLTISSNSPNLLLATSPAGPFSQTITSTINTNGTGASGFSMQALAGSGTATITASAPGYATGTITVTLVPSGVLWENGSFSTTTFSANTTLTLAMVQLNPTTLANAGVQELRTGATPVTVTLGSSNATVGTIPSSVIFTADVSTVTASFQPLTAGTTNLTITTPSGFSTPTPATATQITATVTAPQLTPNFAATLGMNLQTDSGSVSLGATPPSSRTLTISSNSPNLLLATSPAGPFSQTITSTINTNGTGASGFSMQALAGSGAVTITASAPGYATGTITVTLVPSGVLWENGSFSTTTFSANTTLTLAMVQLNPTTLANAGVQELRTGATPVTVTLGSSNTTVGTIPSSVIFTADASTVTTSFQPLTAGTTNLTITTPSGFSTPTPTTATQITATVTAPQLTPNFAATLGMNLQTDSGSVSLGATPPSSRTLTISSNSPNLLLATSPAGPFSQTITSTINTNGTGASGFSMQALAGSGTATITASAPGYATGTITVTLVPSGVLWENGSFSTTTFSANTTLTLAMVQLNPTTLANAGVQELRTGATPVTVTLGSSNATVGTIPSSVTFTADASTVTTSFQPLTAGTTNLTITTPSGFSTPTPTTATQITATVTAPQLTPNFAATLGMNLQTDSGSVSLGATPPSSEMMTITSSSPTLLLATSPAGPFSQTITSTINTNGTGASGFSMQALAGSGSVQIKAQAAGYTDGVITVTLVPSGVIWENGSFSTTPTAPPTTLTLAMAQLNPTTLANAGVQELRTGATPVTVTLGSSNTTVGTIPSSVTFTADASTVTASFQPLTAGTTNLTITTPSGFSTPTPTTATQITATVN